MKILSFPLLTAKLSVLELITVFPPYLRLALGRWPFQYFQMKRKRKEKNSFAFFPKKKVDLVIPYYHTQIYIFENRKRKPQFFLFLIKPKLNYKKNITELEQYLILNCLTLAN